MMQTNILSQELPGWQGCFNQASLAATAKVLFFLSVVQGGLRVLILS